MLRLAWGAFLLVGGLSVWQLTRRHDAPHHVITTPEHLLLVSPSGWQTMSKRDGGRTGHYYDVAEDLLRGQPGISRVVLLGLGGGEMLKAAQRSQPRARLYGVEIDEHTAWLAKTAFVVPGEVIVADAIDWIHAQTPATLDVVFVDLYNDSVLVEASAQPEFLLDCALALRPFGLFAMNVAPAALAPLIEARLAPFFVTAQVRYSEDSDNVVITGMRRP